MGLKYLKRATQTGEQSLSNVRYLVQDILSDIEKQQVISAISVSFDLVVFIIFIDISDLYLLMLLCRT